MVFHHLVGDVPAVQIEVADHRDRGAALAATALVAEAFLGDVGQGEQVGRIGGPVLADRKRAGAPVRHDPEHRAHVVDQLVSLLGRLDVDVAREARLGATEAVRHQLTGVLAGGIERPLVQLSCLDVIAEAVAGGGEQVPQAPGGIRRPLRSTKAPRPDAGIDQPPGGRIHRGVRWDPHLDAAH